MKIRLKPLRLKRRERPVLQSGAQQSFIRVLAIAMLEGDRLYDPDQVSENIWNTQEFKATSDYQSDMLSMWATSNGRNLNLFPDNSPEEVPMWLGQNWQNQVSDTSWNRAVTVLEKVHALSSYDEKQGQSFSYWWDCAEGGVCRAPSDLFEPWETCLHDHDTRCTHLESMNINQESVETEDEVPTVTLRRPNRFIAAALAFLLISSLILFNKNIEEPAKPSKEVLDWSEKVRDWETTVFFDDLPIDDLDSYLQGMESVKNVEESQAVTSIECIQYKLSSNRLILSSFH